MPPVPDAQPLIVPATVHGRTLVRPSSGPRGHWLVGFHGQAQSAEVFLPGLVAADPDARWCVAAVQALHPHYNRRDEVVATWMTRQDREHAIADNVAYVDAVLDALAREHGEPRTLVLAGFSQGVAMAWRAARMGRRCATVLFTVGGDTPPESRRSGPGPWPRVESRTGDQDPWYTPERLAADATELRSFGVEVTTRLFAGGHEWNEAVVAELRGVLEGAIGGGSDG